MFERITIKINVIGRHTKCAKTVNQTTSSLTLSYKKCIGNKMKKQLYLLLMSFIALLLLSNCSTNTKSNKSETSGSNLKVIKDVDIYYVQRVEYIDPDRVFFHVSLSETLPPDADKKILPANLTPKKYTLTDKERKLFMKMAGIAEDAYFWIYDYTNNQLYSYPILSVEATAILDVFRYEGSPPYNTEDYRIGFDLPQDLLPRFRSNYDLFVSITKDNPFAQEQLTPLDWRLIPNANYPDTGPDKLSNRNYGNVPKYLKSYMANANNMTFYVQDYVDEKEPQRRDIYKIFDRELLVVDNEGNTLFKRRMYQSEGTSLVGLNNYHDYENEKFQWAGQLFKDLPPVVFGFEWFSFSCEGLDFIVPYRDGIEFKCDNRH